VGAPLVRVAAAAELSVESILTRPVWKDMKGEMKSVVLQK